MDWSRAKNILILIFILLNVFLSITIINEFRGSSVTKETISNARLALKERGVEVNCSIPDYDGSVGTLTYKKISFDQRRLVENIFGDRTNIDDLLVQEAIEKDGKELRFLDEYSFLYKNMEPGEIVSGLNNSDKILGYVEKILKGTGIPVLDYRIDSVEHGKKGVTTYVFRQKYRDVWIVENHITVNLSDKDLVVMLRYQKVDIIKNSKKVMPVYQVLLKNHEIIKDITINKIDLGFKNQKKDDGGRELDGIPVWCIEIQDMGNKAKKYFNAYDGDEIE
jgi:regulatory protein YycI of two-component signal transduction system YycFG